MGDKGTRKYLKTPGQTGGDKHRKHPKKGSGKKTPKKQIDENFVFGKVFEEKGKNKKQKKRGVRWSKKGQKKGKKNTRPQKTGRAKKEKVQRNWKTLKLNFNLKKRS